MSEPISTALRDLTGAFDRAGIPALVFGSIAKHLLGRPGWSPEEDIDFLIRSRDARDALAVAGETGFDTNEHDPDWIFKAERPGVKVDLIFRPSGLELLDAEALERARREKFLGETINLLGPEDLAIIGALTTREDRTKDWFDALHLLRRGLDWGYLTHRGSRLGADRVLGLLAYARSEGIVVPAGPIAELSRLVRS